MKKITIAILIAAALAIIVAFFLCFERPTQENKRSTPLTSGKTIIYGTVWFKGVVPAMKQIDMSADPVCVNAHDKPVYTEYLVLGEGNTMGNIFVRIASGLPKKDYPIPQEPVGLQFEGCVLKPHVFGMRAGQTLKILNMDGTLHNLHPRFKNNHYY